MYVFNPIGLSFKEYIFCIYTIGIKLSIFYVTLIFRSHKYNFSFGFYLICTLLFWLQTFATFGSFREIFSSDPENEEMKKFLLLKKSQLS